MTALMDSMSISNRRQVASRNSGFAQTTARVLAGWGVSPNQVSTASIFFSLAAFAAFYFVRENSWYLILAVLFIQCRLLCNLFDGMLAIEYDKKSKVGELYNEVPDRISDALIILGAGIVPVGAFGNSGVSLAAWSPWVMQMAWACVFLATMTAYVRVFGASLVGTHYFLGPMAKQHRMFLISLACIVNLFFENALAFALGAMVVGLVITLVRRLNAVAEALKQSRS